MHEADASRLIDSYIAQMPEWQRVLAKKLRAMIHEADPQIAEDWKWGGPAFVRGQVVFGFWAFKYHLTLVFQQGALMRDSHALFNSGKDNAKTRSIQFFAYTRIDAKMEKQLREYLKEAVQNAKDNKRVILAKRERVPIVIPDFVREALEKEKLLYAFEGKTYSHKREYLAWITSAVMEETRLRRLAKMIRTLKEGPRESGAFMPQQSHYEEDAAPFSMEEAMKEKGFIFQRKKKARKE